MLCCEVESRSIAAHCAFQPRCAPWQDGLVTARGLVAISSRRQCMCMASCVWIFVDDDLVILSQVMLVAKWKQLSRVLVRALTVPTTGAHTTKWGLLAACRNCQSGNKPCSAHDLSPHLSASCAWLVILVYPGRPCNLSNSATPPAAATTHIHKQYFICHQQPVVVPGLLHIHTAHNSGQPWSQWLH